MTALEFAALKLRAEARNYVEAQEHEDDPDAGWLGLRDAALHFAAQLVSRSRARRKAVRS